MQKVSQTPCGAAVIARYANSTRGFKQASTRATNHKKMVSLAEKDLTPPLSQNYEMRPTNSLIIIDYDDTLLPSTWLTKRRFFEGPQEVTEAV